MNRANDGEDVGRLEGLEEGWLLGLDEVGLDEGVEVGGGEP